MKHRNTAPTKCPSVPPAAPPVADVAADYVSVARLGEATDLCEAVRAAEEGLLDEKQAGLERLLEKRAEVLP